MIETTEAFLRGPGVCFICEHAPSPESRFVDTQREYDNDMSHLRGRKFLCKSCIVGALKALLPAEAPE